jgi:hypothetical protein
VPEANGQGILDTSARYLIGCLLGAAIGALAVWQWAHDDADRVLRDWEAAATNQQAAERKRADAINRRVQDGHTRDLTELRRRLLAGWRPAIPAAAPVPAGDLPNAAAGSDAGAAEHLPSAGRSAAEVELATCTAERARLIGDGAETTLQLLSLQRWIRAVGSDKFPTESAGSP